MVFELFNHRKCWDSTCFSWNPMHQRYWLVVYQTHFLLITHTFSHLPCSRWGHVDGFYKLHFQIQHSKISLVLSSTFFWQTEKENPAGGSSAMRRRRRVPASFHWSHPPNTHIELLHKPVLPLSYIKPISHIWVLVIIVVNLPSLIYLGSLKPYLDFSYHSRFLPTAAL